MFSLGFVLLSKMLGGCEAPFISAAWAGGLLASSHTPPSAPEMKCSHSKAVNLKSPSVGQSLSGWARSTGAHPLTRAASLSPSWDAHSRGRTRCAVIVPNQESLQPMIGMEIYTLIPPGPATRHKLEVFNIIYAFFGKA